MRVVQLSDSHLSAASGIPGSVQSLLDWINADPPDLVVHTGDIVWFDPDDTLDRAFARLVLSKLPCPLLSIPGNHDVGFFETERAPARLATFREGSVVIPFNHGSITIHPDTLKTCRGDCDDFTHVKIGRVCTPLKNSAVVL